MGGAASQSSPIKQNQTREEWTSQADARGTGIFVREHPGGGLQPKQFVENLSYADCILQGTRAVAFKWVPESVATVSELKAMACPREQCVDTCVRPACVCLNNFCQ
jgi:hypothetical protein